MPTINIRATVSQHLTDSTTGGKRLQVDSTAVHICVHSFSGSLLPIFPYIVGGLVITAAIFAIFFLLLWYMGEDDISTNDQGKELKNVSAVNGVGKQSVSLGNAPPSPEAATTSVGPSVSVGPLPPPPPLLDPRFGVMDSKLQLHISIDVPTKSDLDVQQYIISASKVGPKKLKTLSRPPVMPKSAKLSRAAKSERITCKLTPAQMNRPTSCPPRHAKNAKKESASKLAASRRVSIKKAKTTARVSH